MLGSCFTHCILLFVVEVGKFLFMPVPGSRKLGSKISGSSKLGTEISASCILLFVIEVGKFLFMPVPGIRQHTSAYVVTTASSFSCRFLAYVSIRQHTSAYVSIRRQRRQVLFMPAGTPSVGRDLRFSYSALPNSLTELQHVTALTN